MTTDQAVTADDKKERKLPERPDPKLPERVTYRKWVVQGVNKQEKFFLPPRKDCKASLYAGKSQVMCRLDSANLPGGGPSPGSEVIEADGTVWVVEKANAVGDFYLLYLKPKTPPKKD